MSRALSVGGKAVATLAILGAASAACASPLSYSIQFFAIGDSNTSNELSANPGLNAGAYSVPASEWNLVSIAGDYGSSPANPAFGTFSSFANSSGNTSGSPTLSGTVYDFNESSATGAYTEGMTSGTGNAMLFSDIFAANQNEVTNEGPFTMALTNVPFSSYNVYIYFCSTNSTLQTYSVSDNSGTYYYSNGDIGTLTSLVAATTNSGSPIAADYAEFSESNSSATFTLNPPTPNGNIFISGMQIVQTPEPTALGILGAIGAVALIRRRAP